MPTIELSEEELGIIKDALEGRIEKSYQRFASHVPNYTVEGMGYFRDTKLLPFVKSCTELYNRIDKILKEETTNTIVVDDRESRQ